MVLRRTNTKCQRALFILSALLLLSSCRNGQEVSVASQDIRATPIVVSGSPSPGAITPSPSESIAKICEEVDRVIIGSRERYPGKSSIVFVDLDSGTTLAYAENARYESASLVKLMVLVELYREIQMGAHRLDEELVLLEKQRVGGSGSLKNAPEGIKYSLGTLAELMIIESDNTATQMLTDLLSRTKIAHGMKTIGLRSSTIDRDIYDFDAIDKGQDNYTTAKDIASLLLQLAHQDLPGSGPMNEILERQKRNDLFGNGFPAGVRIAHKTGELDGILHDAAIIYAPRGTFVLVALGEEVSDKKAAAKVWSQMALDVLKAYSRK